MPMPPELWTIEDVARHLRVKVTTAHALARIEGLPAVLARDGTLRFDSAAVKAWALQRQKQ